MAVELQKTDGIARVLKITIPADAIAGECDKELPKVAKNVRLAGFRPGKVPVNVVKKQFGDAIRSDVLGKLIEKFYMDGLKAQKLNPAGMPKIDVVHDKAGEDFVFNASFEIFPEIKVQGLNKIEVEKVSANVTEEDLNQMLDTLRKQHVKYEKAERAAQDGDRVVIDFEGFLNGEAFQGGSAKDIPLVLGSKSMIEGFEAGIIGMKSGDTRDVNVTFPDNYQAENLKGKAAVFKITVKEVNAPVLPELNDEFAQLFKMDNVDALKQEIKQNMERELEFNLKARLKNQVLSGLLKHNEIHIPQALIDDEAKRLQHAAIHRFEEQQGLHVKDHKHDPKLVSMLPVDMFKEEGKRRVALGLLVGRLIDSEQIKLDESKVQAMIEKMASVYEDPAEVVRHFNQDKNRRNEIEQIVLEEQVVEHILDKAKVKEKTMKFSEVMQQKG